MEKIHSTDIGSDFIKKMQKLKTSKRNTLKQKFKIHKKLSKYIIGKKEKNIASVLWNSAEGIITSVQGTVSKKSPDKKLTYLEWVLKQIAKIEARLVIKPNMSLRRKNSLLKQVDQIDGIKSIIEIEEDRVYNTLEDYYMVYEKVFFEPLLDDRDFYRYDSFGQRDYEDEKYFDEELYKELFEEEEFYDEETYDTDFEELEGFHAEEEEE